MFKTFGSRVRGNMGDSLTLDGTAQRAHGRKLACVLALVGAGALAVSASAASAAVLHPSLVQTIATSAYSPSSPDPSGIAYRSGPDRLILSDSEVEETPLYGGFNLFTATRTGSGIGTGTTFPAFSKEPTDLGIRPANGTLFISDDDRDRIFIVAPGPDGRHGTSDDNVRSFRTAPFGSTDPEGVVFDPATGHLFVSDGAGIEIYRINPVNGVFGDANDTVTHFDVARHGAGDVEGLGLDPNRQRLLAVDPNTDSMYELGKGGALFNRFDLSAIPTTRSLIADVTMAPTSSTSDPASTLDYWIVDRHRDNNNLPDENDGLLYEMR
jgi:DNA-binding beta-propeller fold protein YncE